MSIKERIEGLIRAGGDQEMLAQLEIDKKRQHAAELAAKAHKKERGALKEQWLLVEDLRELGIISMIEEVTGQTIPSYTAMHGALTRKKAVREKPQDQGFEPWLVEVLGPALQPNGDWNTVLNFGIERIFETGSYRGRRGRVSVTYTKDRHLTITGGEITFDSGVSNDPLGQIQVRDSLAMAFANPRIY